MANNTTDMTPFPIMNSSECTVLHPQIVVPWNNSENIISLETKETVRKVKNSVILPITFLIGVPANIINMAVFYKQGLKERINVCLFALSLSDGLYLVAHMVTYGERIPIYFTNKVIDNSVSQWMTNSCLLGLFGLTWVSQVLTAIVASERCFCVMQPLKSQTVLHTSTMTAIIVAVFLVVMGGRFVVVTRYYYGCFYDPIRDMTIIKPTSREFYKRNQKFVEFLDVFMYGLGLPWITIVVIIAATVITLVKLRQAAEWRMGKSSSAGSMSAQEIALTRMLVGNSIFFIACVFPVGLYRLIVLFVPHMNIGGRHANVFILGILLIHITSYINSTFNIIVYYAMGSRYRHTLWTLLRRKSTKDTSSRASLTVANT